VQADPRFHQLNWIDRANELGFNMEDSSALVIWRCIQRSPVKRFWHAAFSREVFSPDRPPKDLEVLFECRPYELGWLLYAWAGRKFSNYE
jgi:hypothetical protein